MNRPGIVGDLINFLAQSQIETFDFTALRESLYYTTKTRTVEQIYSISPTAINKSFDKKGLGQYTRQQKINYIRDKLISNDKAYGILVSSKNKVSYLIETLSSSSSYEYGEM